MKPLLLSLLLVLAASQILVGGENAEARKAGKAAMDFVTAYLKATEHITGYKETIAWVKKSPLVTSDYKTALEKLYKDAWRKDPEYGYGADAILSSQDNPESYSIDRVKAKGGSAWVELAGHPNYQGLLKVGLVRQDGNWLVNSSGDVNQ